MFTIVFPIILFTVWQVLQANFMWNLLKGFLYIIFWGYIKFLSHSVNCFLEIFMYINYLQLHLNLLYLCNYIHINIVISALCTNCIVCTQFLYIDIYIACIYLTHIIIHIINLLFIYKLHFVIYIFVCIYSYVYINNLFYLIFNFAFTKFYLQLTNKSD